MACKCVLALLGACLLAFVSPVVGSCYFNSDCTYQSSGGSYCCGGKCTYFACSYTTNCLLNSDCSGAKYCCDSGDCRYSLSDCPLSTASIGGIVGGLVVVVGIIVAVIACCVCACCPLHRSHRHGQVIVTRQPYQNLQSTTVSATSTTVQPPLTYPQPAQSVAPPPYSGPQQPGQQPFPGQQPHPGQQPYPAQQPYPGQQPFPGQQPYPGQQQYPAQPPYPTK